MESILAFITIYWVWLGPTAITLLLVVFLRSRSRPSLRELDRFTHEHYMRTAVLRDYGKDDGKPTALTQLLQRDDVTLRVLEEVYEPPPRVAARREIRSSDAYRLSALESLQREIRSQLRSAVTNEDFPKVRDRLLTLLDEIKTERERLQHKEPFNDMLDPEKSLLIDIFQELEGSPGVIRQKTLQLANVIKIKHQDILKLQAENAKAASWTKWGTAGTVVFGVLSLVLSVVTIKV